MSVCDKVISPAAPGDYTLHVTQVGTTDTVHGVHGLNGAEVEAWTHADLVADGPQTIVVGSGDRHALLVLATFANDDTFTVELRRGDTAVATCVLTKNGYTSSSMSLIAAEDD